MCKFIKKKKRGKMLRKPRRKLIYTMPFSSPETKKAYEKNISVEVVYWMNEDVFQKTLSFMNSFYEEIYKRKFDISVLGRPDPTLGYSTGLLVEARDSYTPIIFTKWGVIHFPFFEHMGISEIESIKNVRNAILKLGLYKTYGGYYVSKELEESKIVPPWERSKDYANILTAWDKMIEEYKLSDRSNIEHMVPVLAY